MKLYVFCEILVCNTWLTWPDVTKLDQMLHAASLLIVVTYPSCCNIVNLKTSFLCIYRPFPKTPLKNLAILYRLYQGFTASEHEVKSADLPFLVEESMYQILYGAELESLAVGNMSHSLPT